MDAIILAAGLGTRLRPHTLTTPKPMLPVRGRPILDWTLAALPKAVERVIVVTHYLREQVDDYLKQQQHFRDWVTVFQQTPRGTGDAFMSCRDAVKSEQVFVLNGDDLYAAGVKILEAALKTPQLGVAERSPVAAIENQHRRPVLFQDLRKSHWLAAGVGEREFRRLLPGVGRSTGGGQILGDNQHHVAEQADH